MNKSKSGFGFFLGIIVGVILIVGIIVTVFFLLPLNSQTGVVTSVKRGSSNSTYIVTITLPDNTTMTTTVHCKTFSLGSKLNITGSFAGFFNKITLPSGCN